MPQVLELCGIVKIIWGKAHGFREKIEAGQRSPGMGTFIKIMVELDVNISLHGTGKTVQEKCIIAMQDIVSDCTEGEARYLAHMVKCMADSFPLMI